MKQFQPMKLLHLDFDEKFFLMVNWPLFSSIGNIYWGIINFWISLKPLLNPFQPSVVLPLPLKTSKNLKVFCFQVWQCNTGLKLVNPFQANIHFLPPPPPESIVSCVKMLPAKKEKNVPKFYYYKIIR